MLPFLHTHKKATTRFHKIPIGLFKSSTGSSPPVHHALDVTITGGLGNRMFQLATGLHFARLLGRTFFISSGGVADNLHSKQNYFETIFAEFAPFVRSLPLLDYANPSNIPRDILCVRERFDQVFHLQEPGSQIERIHLMGCFQYYSFIPSDFVRLLRFDSSITNKYPLLNVSAFLHVRGGDYKTSSFHWIDLTHYYTRSIEYLQKQSQPSHYYVFTDDPAYCKQQPFLQGISYTMVQENEIDSLYLMSQCKKGAICANSSFSWWGAYLNRDRPITLPSKWSTDPHHLTRGFYFPESKVVPISPNPDATPSNLHREAVSVRDS